MIEWLKKPVPCFGEVLFRGTLPPRPEEFAFLRERGLTVERPKAKPDMQWVLLLKHPEWGQAILHCSKGDVSPPRFMIEHTYDLSSEEREAALSAGCSLCLKMAAKREHVLRDRKYMLRFLGEVMGGDGVAAIDFLAQRVWSREALDEELSHDADLDIAQIYAMHAVSNEGKLGEAVVADEDRACWLHSHGLAEIGYFDFDILNPSPDLDLVASDVLRAIAFRIVEGKVGPSTKRHRVAEPGGTIRFVPVAEFDKRAEPSDVALRGEPDGCHENNRSVLCDPPKRLFGGFSGRVRPSTFLSGEIEEELLIQFSNEATDLAAERAHKTYELFRDLTKELGEIGALAIVKLGYRMDGGGKDDREYLWFTVHEAGPEKIDATLDSPPFRIERLKVGDRRQHSVNRLSDWTIVTPIGPVSPRSTRVVRHCRAHWDELVAIGRRYREHMDRKRADHYAEQ